MQSVSELFNRIWENPNHYVETKVTIAGVEYGESSILSLSTSGKLFSENIPTIGCCVSSELEIEIMPKEDAIPRMAEIKVYTRVCDSENESEWIPRGVYYIDQRSKNKSLGTIRIHAYDGMMKFEQDFCVEGEQGQWPRTDTSVVYEILERTGISLDTNSISFVSKMIPYPGIGDGAYSMREILGNIACMYCGNWTISPEGKLKFVPLGGLPVETNRLVDEYGNHIKIGGDYIIV